MKPVKKHILLSEDDASFGLLMKSYLELHNYKVTLCENGEEALAMFKTQSFDLCILDVMMPKMDGFTLASKIKKLNNEVPFIFLTAKSLKEDLLSGYKLGAEDYLIKPFDSEILLLKIEVILKRGSFEEAGKQIASYQIGNFIFLPDTRKLSLYNETAKLSPKESELLHLLCKHHSTNSILPREEALLRIWKEDDYFTTRSMDVHITKLRNYFKKDTSCIVSIDNIHSKGFKLTVE